MEIITVKISRLMYSPNRQIKDRCKFQTQAMITLKLSPRPEIYRGLTMWELQIPKKNLANMALETHHKRKMVAKWIMLKLIGPNSTILIKSPHKTCFSLKKSRKNRPNASNTSKWPIEQPAQVTTRGLFLTMIKMTRELEVDGTVRTFRIFNHMMEIRSSKIAVIHNIMPICWVSFHKTLLTWIWISIYLLNRETMFTMVTSTLMKMANFWAHPRRSTMGLQFQTWT